MAKSKSKARGKLKAAKPRKSNRVAGPTRVAKSARSGRKRASEQTFPEIPDLKDGVLMRHAKTYADEMFASEEALQAATGEKQAIRSRMAKLNATLFVGHGYEFTRVPGEETFKARKTKRGAKPADTSEPVDEQPEVPVHDFSTDSEEHVEEIH
jgi:hypothetical protein